MTIERTITDALEFSPGRPRGGVTTLGSFARAGNALVLTFSADELAKAFVARHEAEVRPLEKASSLAWWVANVSGKDEISCQEAAQNRLDARLADHERFAHSRRSRSSRSPTRCSTADRGPLSAVPGKQVDPALLEKITAKANAIEQAFNVFRAKVDGKEMTDSEVRKVLKTRRTRASARRSGRPARASAGSWRRSEGTGQAAQRGRQVARLHNFHAMQLHLNEQSQDAADQLFDELDELTREPFHKAKAEIDTVLAKTAASGRRTSAVALSTIRSSRKRPPSSTADLDAVYANADILKLCREFYAGIGLPIDDVMARSDLYEKPGKSPHAFCTDIDREATSASWPTSCPTNTGWARCCTSWATRSTAARTSRVLPYVLRTEAHILTTEGVAMMFEHFSKNADGSGDGRDV